MLPIDVLRAGLSATPSAHRPAGIEVRQELAPAAGAPVSPPSYLGELEIHARHVDGQVRDVIELDSVGSSANRIEEALLVEHREGRYPLPLTSTAIESAGQRFDITTLEAPHRLFDAWIRLSSLPDEERAFEQSERGHELSLAHLGALDPILEASSHDLLLGVWDSHRTGPSGQVRIARSFVSTVLGFDPLKVDTRAARVDPLNLGEAAQLKGPDVKRLSERGLSSIPPQVRRPGVSISAARFVGFVSFASLRRLRFDRYDDTDVRVALAALCLHGLMLRESAGWSLRSECDLVPTGDLALSVVRGGGAPPEALPLTLEDTRALLDEAVGKAGIADRGLRLVGGPTLMPLVERGLAASVAREG
ncbi:MAG: type I-U CRISPR-associated protein Cas7 [Solirubrobacterales bacterium]|nr:type I-U CRISPR-associated protein Cas7 [Solirubrobacterales bacterium]